MNALIHKGQGFWKLLILQLFGGPQSAPWGSRRTLFPLMDFTVFAGFPSGASPRSVAGKWVVPEMYNIFWDSPKVFVFQCFDMFSCQAYPLWMNPPPVRSVGIPQKLHFPNDHSLCPFAFQASHVFPWDHDC